MRIKPEFTEGQAIELLALLDLWRTDMRWIARQYELHGGLPPNINGLTFTGQRHILQDAIDQAKRVT